MKKIIVAAVAENRVIGTNGQLPWHLPADLDFFEKTIAGQFLLSGRKSVESDQGNDLFNRPEQTIILTRQKDYRTKRGKVIHSIEEAFNLAKALNVPSLYILGGAKVYEQTIDLADQLIITEIHGKFKGDSFFPNIDLTKWKEVSREDYQKDEKNAYDYSFVIYKNRVGL